MATRNEQALAETAELLLKQIRESAADSTHPPDLLQLAQAYAYLAGNDPNLPPPAPFIG